MKELIGFTKVAGEQLKLGLCETGGGPPLAVVTNVLITEHKTVTYHKGSGFSTRLYLIEYQLTSTPMNGLTSKYVLAHKWYACSDAFTCLHQQGCQFMMPLSS